jgi:uncharacterized protein (TIGR00730 family)
MERAPKAYKNAEFLSSSSARTLRILAEYLEPMKRFNDAGIKHTVVFFGSSRTKPAEPGTDNSKINMSLKSSGFDSSKYYEAAEEFAYRLASWSGELEKKGDGFIICSGGGPGIMEAANRGAQRAKASTIGLNISIPFEQAPNDYISPHLNFEFHYFFMRKLWFLYHAKALIVFPGGFGTFDELFETLTLVQTQKLQKYNIPILLYDRSFWEQVINFKKLAEFKVISPKDLNLFRFFSSPSEGLEILKPPLEELIRNFKY